MIPKIREIGLIGALAASALFFDGSVAAAAEEYEIKIPLGLSSVVVPEDNSMTAEKVELGRILYFDKRLSKDDSVSCASCHDPRKGFTDQLPRSVGIGGQLGGVNAPTVINSAYRALLFWDGRAKDLEEQVTGPIQNPVEMGMPSMEAAAAKLAKIRGYRERFKKVFGTKVTPKGIIQAIAAFERTILSGNAPYDRYLAGDAGALSEAAKRGEKLFFEKGNCNTCHTAPTFSDEDFHNIGVGMDAPEPPAGRFAVTKRESDWGAFKTPTLRNLRDTAPYQHDGSQKTLEDVMAFYNKGGIPNKNLSKDMRPLELTDQEVRDLIAFLDSLQGEVTPVEPPKEFP